MIEPRVFVVLSKAKMISPEGTSKPFSSQADGYGRGEGCGVILLKPLKKVRIWTMTIVLLSNIAMMIFYLTTITNSLHISYNMILC